MTGVRIAIKWTGDPDAALKASAERAIQKGARSTGCFGSAELGLDDDGIAVSAARIVSGQDPSGSAMRNSVEVVRRWLRIGAVPTGP